MTCFIYKKSIVFVFCVSSFLHPHNILVNHSHGLWCSVTHEIWTYLGCWLRPWLQAVMSVWRNWNQNLYDLCFSPCILSDTYQISSKYLLPLSLKSTASTMLTFPILAHCNQHKQPSFYRRQSCIHCLYQNSPENNRDPVSKSQDIFIFYNYPNVVESVTYK